MTELPDELEDVYQRLRLLCNFPDKLEMVFDFDYLETARKLRLVLKKERLSIREMEYTSLILHALKKAYRYKGDIFKNITQIQKEEIVPNANKQSDAYDEQLGMYVSIPGHDYHYGLIKVKEDDRERWYNELKKELFTYHEIINQVVPDPDLRPCISKKQAELLYNFDLSSDDEEAEEIHLFGHDPGNYKSLIAVLTDISSTYSEIAALKVRFGCNQNLAGYVLRQLNNELCFPYKFSVMEKLGCFYISGNEKMKARNIAPAASRYRPTSSLLAKINTQIDQLKEVIATNAT